jgi:hypothetical protein
MPNSDHRGSLLLAPSTDFDMVPGVPVQQHLPTKELNNSFRYP